MKNTLTRREFLKLTTQGFGACFIANCLTGCISPVLETKSSLKLSKATFPHGVASGDPLSDSVILWTRAQADTANTDSVYVGFAVATDSDFANIVFEDLVQTGPAVNYTVKIDVKGLEPDTNYYYRFESQDTSSKIGKTRTLPAGNVDKVKLLVLSCAFYSAGYFNVYKEAAKVSDANAVLHLGDYIYEYGPGVYADEEAESMQRVMDPASEIYSLGDYRKRYAQTRSDADLQTMHAAHPIIPVWDDHEVSNDAWADGAENHSQEQGEFSARKVAALQAYAEWMPIRPLVENDIESIQRSFQFGNLVHLSMLDTRLVAREAQIDYADYTDTNTGAFDGQAYSNKLNDPERALLGQKQLLALTENFAKTATWHVLGQQVLMGEMRLPAPVVSQDLSIAAYLELESRDKTHPGSLSKTEQGILAAPWIPYNLDAWDGYPAERKKLLTAAKNLNVNLVVLAGDTHNAWSSDLRLDGELAGIEFATSSVTSPGLEKYVSATRGDEANTVNAIKGLNYCNMTDRGFMTVTFTKTQVTSQWTFISTVKSRDYSILENRNHQISIKL